jgi:hypothetical protein
MLLSLTVLRLRYNKRVRYLAVHVQVHHCLAFLQAKMALKVPSNDELERAPRGYVLDLMI